MCFLGDSKSTPRQTFDTFIVSFSLSQSRISKIKNVLFVYKIIYLYIGYSFYVLKFGGANFVYYDY